MPSKRTNDSVDRILEELSHEQAERGIRDSVTDRQVDAILQSLGHGSMEESSGGGSALGPIQKEDLPDITLGKGNNFNTEDRFSTAVLDDLLGDLPSMRAAKKNKPGPAAPARRPASFFRPLCVPPPDTFCISCLHHIYSKQDQKGYCQSYQCNGCCAFVVKFLKL